MSTEISIRVPKVIATPAEFAEWEGYSRGSVYQMIYNGKLANYIEKKEKNKKVNLGGPSKTKKKTSSSVNRNILKNRAAKRKKK